MIYALRSYTNGILFNNTHFVPTYILADDTTDTRYSSI